MSEIMAKGNVLVQTDRGMSPVTLAHSTLICRVFEREYGCEVGFELSRIHTTAHAHWDRELDLELVLCCLET